MKIVSIVGRNIFDIPTFYDEINRVLMPNEDWQLADNLDALNDLLYGGYGEINGQEPVRMIWHDIEASRLALGVDATRTFLAKKLERRDIFNAENIQRQLEALDQGKGQTYFDIVIEIIGDHHNIELVAA